MKASFFEAANAYIKRLRNRSKRSYAIAYATRLMEHGTDARVAYENYGLGLMARQAVERDLLDLYRKTVCPALNAQDGSTQN